jgi:hypothetical protein
MAPPVRVRIIIEYDTDYHASATVSDILAEEARHWYEGGVSVPDFLDDEGNPTEGLTVRVEAVG